MWLSVDRGNTTLDCAIGPATVDSDDRRRLDPTSPDALLQFLAGRKPLRAIGATVVAGGLDASRRALAAVGVELIEAGVDLPCPLEIAYQDATELGADRWLGAFAASRDYGDALTIDCGSALTVNAVTARGRFLGGAIAPGLGALASGLAAAAPGLPRASVTDPVELPAVSTPDAVAAGVQLGFAAMVEGLVERLAAAVGGRQFERVVTGGAAPVLLRCSDASYRHVPDLVHRGLRWLLVSSS